MRWFNKATDRAALRAFAAAAALAIGACSGGNGAGTDAAVDAGSGSDVGTATCDPAAQNCASGSECDFNCEGGAAVIACRTDNGNGAIGTACSATQPCAKGSTCIGTVDAGVICRKYCAGDGDCLTGQRCHNDSVSINCGTPPTVLLLHTCY